MRNLRPYIVLPWSQVSSRWIFWHRGIHVDTLKNEFSSYGFKWVFVSRFHCSIMLATGWGGGHCGPSCTTELRSLEDPECWRRGLGSMHSTLTLLPDSIYGHVVLNVTVTWYISILLLQSQTKLKASFFCLELVRREQPEFFPSADVQVILVPSHV